MLVQPARQTSIDEVHQLRHSWVQGLTFAPFLFLPPPPLSSPRLSLSRLAHSKDSDLGKGQEWRRRSNLQVVNYSYLVLFFSVQSTSEVISGRNKLYPVTFTSLIQCFHPPWPGLCHNTLTTPRTPRPGLCHNTLTTPRTPRPGLCHNTLTTPRTPRPGLCHNTLTTPRTPRPGLCHNTLTTPRTPSLQ